MALSESMFLFEMSLEEFQSCIECKHYFIQGQFADLFTIFLRKAKKHNVFSQRPRKKANSRLKGKLKKKSSDDTTATAIGIAEQVKSKSVLFACNLYKLIMYMKQHPLELSLWSRKKPETQMGSTSVQWDRAFLNYLHNLTRTKKLNPISVSGEHYIFDVATSSKCIARVKLQLRMCQIHDRIPIQFRSLSENNVGIFNYSGYLKATKDVEDSIKIDDVANTFIGDMIKEKKETQRTNKKNDVLLNTQTKSDSTEVPHDNAIEKPEEVMDIINTAKSEANISINKRVTAKKSKSFSALIIKDTDAIKYLKQNGPIGKQVYIVGYCTVENDFAKSPKSGSTSTSKTSVKDVTSESDQSRPKYKFKTCASDCPEKQRLEASGSGYSLDIPEDAAHLIRVTKCSELACVTKKREPPEPEDDRILLDFKNLQSNCCDLTEKVEEVVGEMQAKFQVKGLPCECTCECTFGFKKKTTYCHICGGYEIPGDDMTRKPAHAMVPPCPVYHKLVDAKRLRALSTSGSDSKKSQKSMKQTSKSTGVANSRGSTPDKKRSAKSLTDKRSTESEKDMKFNKKGKKKDDSRFKFNYGYQGIPPHIGHGECTAPCTGSMNPVPKSMGWLWTADNIPGMKRPKGWRPGAISFKLLRMLIKAKRKATSTDNLPPKRKPRRPNEDKPALIVRKKDGEYHIEMQVLPDEEIKRLKDIKPLKYSIASANNEAKIKMKEKLQRRLIKQEVKKELAEMYPDGCMDTCLKAYKRFIGQPYNANDPWVRVDESSNSSFDELEYISSSSSSVEWEIQYSPPIMSNCLYER